MHNLYNSYYTEIAGQFDALRLDGGAELEKTLNHLLQTLPSSRDLVLDIGCGTGRFSRQLVQHEFSVLCVDRSISQLKHCPHSLSRICAQAEQLPLPDASVGSCLLIMMLHQVPPTVRRQTFAECRRVIKSNGIIFIKTRSHDDLNKRFLNTYLPSTLTINLQRYPPLDTLTAELSAANFSNIKITPTQSTIILEKDEFLRRIAMRHNSTLSLIDAAELSEGLQRLREVLVGMRTIRYQIHHTIITAIAL